MRAAPHRSATSDWIGWRVDDRDGRMVGTLAAVYEDEDGHPAWFLVQLGGFSRRYVLVPPADVLAVRGRVCMPYDAVTIERAPLFFTPPDEAPAAIEQRLRRHFRLGDADGPRAVRVRARRSVA